MTARRRTLDNRGISLLDVLVSLSLMAVAAGGVFAGFKGSLKAWTVAQQYAGEQHNARTVLDWATRRLRMTGNGYPLTPIAVAKTDEIVFFAETDDPPNGIAECHRLYLNATEQVVYSYVGEVIDCTAEDGERMSTEVEAQTLAVTSLNFQYFDYAGGALTSLPLSTTDRSKVRRIQLTIGASGLQFLPPFTLSTQVLIR